jgi:hypothetical protein
MLLRKPSTFHFVTQKLQEGQEFAKTGTVADDDFNCNGPAFSEWVC